MNSSAVGAAQFLATASQLISTRLNRLCKNVAADVRRRMERTRNAGKSAADGHYEVKLCEAVLKNSTSRKWVKV